AAGDQLGASVAISGDTVVVGAPLSDIGANADQGSAYVFIRSFIGSGADWTQQKKLTAADGAAGNLFGISVALSGDTLAVGAYGDDIGANRNQGSAYVFTRSFIGSGADWTQQKKLTAADGEINNLFGVSVALSGDTLVVGAFNDDIGGNANQGSAYVFIRSG